MFTRKLGRSGIEVSAVGMGCWAIGGQWWYTGDGGRDPCGWGQVDDVRREWDLGGGRHAKRLEQVEAVGEILMQDGRTLAQGALGWIWSRSDKAIPIPGFKTVAQVTENAQAMEFGPLSEAQMQEIDEILGRSAAKG